MSGAARGPRVVSVHVCAVNKQNKVKTKADSRLDMSLGSSQFSKAQSFKTNKEGPIPLSQTP